MTWIRIEQFLPGFMKELFPAVPPPASLSSTSPPPPQADPPAENPQPLHSQSSTDHGNLEGVVVQEVPMTVAVDHVIAGGGGVVTMAAKPMQAQCSPSRSPPGTSPHASPPTTSSPGKGGEKGRGKEKGGGEVVPLCIQCKPPYNGLWNWHRV